MLHNNNYNDDFSSYKNAYLVDIKYIYIYIYIFFFYIKTIKYNAYDYCEFE